MTLLRTARDKGAMACIAMGWETLPLCHGETYEYIAANDLGRLEAYITRLEESLACLLAQMEDDQ